MHKKFEKLFKFGEELTSNNIHLICFLGEMLQFIFSEKLADLILISKILD